MLDIGTKARLSRIFTAVKAHDLEVELGLDPGGKGVVYGLVELNEHSEGEGGAEHLQLHQLIQAGEIDTVKAARLWVADRKETN